ncbi:hypothetical protein [Streptomyces sp. WMMC940]|nr:hypothetical protein [Streptomyces sp. WMMC940]MCZ7458248.1 hypothetical protein [Streptomyces sp. WMMC940]
MIITKYPPQPFSRIPITERLAYSRRLRDPYGDAVTYSHPGNQYFQEQAQ